MAISVDPKVTMYLGGAMTIASVIVGFGSQFTTLFGDHTAQMIVAGSTICTGVCGGLITFLGAASSSTPGPLAAPDSAAMQHLAIEEQKSAVDAAAAAQKADLDKQKAAIPPAPALPPR